ncbi:MAG: hypothetical protein HKN94_04050 [Acidimicrobiales bacterium]|nr:hypothetical protein [Acidimicrobiales bacterium]RZV46825.1 MAG: hypothetical protein EX269_06275 [Acidimicrobiales bacterium]
MKQRPDDVDPFMPPPEYGQSLGGLSLNLLSTDLSRATQFHTDVLEVHVQDHDGYMWVADVPLLGEE